MLLPARRTVGLAALVAAGAVGACFGAGAPLERVVDEGPEDDGAGAAPPDAGPADPPDAGPVDPHGPGGIDPAHGTFAGGLRAVIRGAGFADGMQVWIGGALATDVVVLTPTRVQVVTPPGTPGAADVTTEAAGDASTRRTLEDAYTYDTFHLEPDEGPASGGVITRFVGSGTAWDEDTEARIGGEPCLSLEVVSGEELFCEVPPGTLGAKPVRVGAGDDAVTVLDAFTYDDAPEGVVGGLSGDPLEGRIEVRSFDAFSGEPLVGATVILGSDVDDAIVATADGEGLAAVEDASLTGAVTVTVAFECHQPMTFVDVPVERVNAYLDPILDISCISEIQLPPPTGSGASAKGAARGQIYWDYVNEFQRGPFAVPEPGPTERRAAYVFTASGSPLAFNLPAEAMAITEEAEGTFGYAFEIEVSPGNRVLYALAGLEDRSGPVPRFVPWSMGVLRGVIVAAGVATEDIAIHMKHPLEHALEVALAPPEPTDRGPDRLLVTTSIKVGTEGFLLLPQGKAPRLLPLQGAVDFVGLPLLDGPLQGASYWVSARAATGPDLVFPVSAIASVGSSVAGPIEAGPFVGVPGLVDPAPGGVWDGKTLEVEIGGGESPVDLMVLDVAKPSDIVRWRIAAPGGAQTVRVPDLRQLGMGLPFGALKIQLTAGRIDGFEYGELAYRDLRSQNMDAFAADVFDAHF